MVLVRQPLWELKVPFAGRIAERAQFSPQVTVGIAVALTD
jgi:hypothetical protein